MNLTKNGNPMNWGGIARKAGLYDPNATLRSLWATLNNAEKRVLVQSANLPPNTVIQQILQDEAAEKIKAAIRRASSWAQKLEGSL